MYVNPHLHYINRKTNKHDVFVKNTLKQFKAHTINHPTIQQTVTRPYDVSFGFPHAVYAS